MKERTTEENRKYSENQNIVKLLKNKWHIGKHGR